MARVRVRVVNFSEDFQDRVPELRKRLLEEARVDLQCETDGCFLITFGAKSKLQLMKAILEEFGCEFYYPTADYVPDWASFQPLEGCNCLSCRKGREFIAAQKTEGNGEKTEPQPRRKKAKRKQ